MRDPGGNLCFIIKFKNEGVFKMDKYVKAEMEVIEFENEDVITTSGCDLNCPPNDNQIEMD